MAAAAPVLTVVTPAQAALTTVADWPMTGDPMTDTSGNGNTGTLKDVTVLPGGGYEFAASDSHVTVPDNDSLDPGANAISYTVHLRLAAAPASGTDYDVIRKGLAGTTGGEWKMEVLPNSTTGTANPFCLFKDDAGHTDSIRGSQNLADGNWHSVTCIRTTSTNKLIIDGVTKTSTPSTPLTGSISNTAPVVLGQKLGGGDQYNGDMQDVTIQIGQLDSSAPTVASTNPASGATGVSTSTSVSATFSEPVLNVGGSTFTLKNAANGTAVSAAVTYDSGTNTATLQPSAALAAGASYTATLTNGITGTTGNPLTATSWNFTTAGIADFTKPTVTAKSPAAGATSIPTSTNVTATFSEPVQLVSGTTFTLKLAGTTTAVSSTVTYDSSTNTATLHPNALLTAGTKYTATLTSGIKDVAGNSLSSTSWNFTTATGTTGTAPTFKSGTPASNANSVGLATNVTATFTQKVQNVTGSTFTLTPDGGTAVAAAYTSNSTGTKWTLNPTVNLIKDHWYTVNLTPGITNTSNTALAAPVSWRFLTGPAPTVSSKTPAKGAAGVSTATTVTATFNEPVLNVTSATFTLKNAAGNVNATVTRSGSTNKWILTPSAPLQSATVYTATLVGGSSGITDLVGNPLRTVTWSFTTG